MAGYRKIDSRIWNDAKFNGMSNDAKLAFMFCLTHPLMNSMGVMRGTIEGLGAELGYTSEAMRVAIQEAIQAGMVDVDEKASFIGVRNFIKYNEPGSVNVVKSWSKFIDLIPECPLKDEYFKQVIAYVDGMPKAFGDAIPVGMRDSLNSYTLNSELYKSPSDSLKRESSSGRRSLSFIHDAIDMELATEFFQSVQSMLPNSKFPVMVEWAAEFKSMRTKDPPDRTPENIREMFAWAHGDEFWRQAVLTPMSLRKNWDTITLRRSSSKELNAITDGI